MKTASNDLIILSEELSWTRNQVLERLNNIKEETLKMNREELESSKEKIVEEVRFCMGLLEDSESEEVELEEEPAKVISPSY
ncbi:hypothetical protein [Bacillus atrophaeus]|uniref:hypothetical protein n=1 Tax=Bacillus atrophaeus TaxID=1452 RepID=UPI002281D00F|nr:hypothetical protein [Bacillus atrophaeus]MCY8890418.1 hypothetical protein [Bacillus spizizenii]MEC0841873.1 hypothetical protein [Bacillus spizizenii]MED1125237.1 hypothetical protein [Bacillus atrophaeus]